MNSEEFAWCLMGVFVGFLIGMPLGIEYAGSITDYRKIVSRYEVTTPKLQTSIDQCMTELTECQK